MCVIVIEIFLKLIYLVTKITWKKKDEIRNFLNYWPEVYRFKFDTKKSMYSAYPPKGHAGATITHTNTTIFYLILNGKVNKFVKYEIFNHNNPRVWYLTNTTCNTGNSRRKIQKLFHKTDGTTSIIITCQKTRNHVDWSHKKISLIVVQLSRCYI